MIHFKLYTSSNDLPKEWTELSQHDLLLQIPYLRAMEMASPTNISWYYIGIFKADQLVAITVIQRVQLYLKDMFRNRLDSFFKQKGKDLLSYILKGNMLVVGNMTHTGQHGVYVSQELSYHDFLNVVFEALESLKATIWKEQKKRIRVILFKDYFTDDMITENQSLLLNHQLHVVKVQPNMIMPIKDHWKTFEDYLKDLNKKYLRRYRTAKKKAQNIQKKEMELNDIVSAKEPLFHLYKNVSDNAAFNTFILPKNHLESLKKELKDQFRVIGYYFEGQLIGFYTLLLNNDQLETYFLGYHPNHQYQNQLYLNMLYDMAAFGINNHFKSVVYARTAMEIKSSVGAEGKPMVVYMKHTNSFVNGLFKQIFKLMNPSKNWEERHPFKD